MNGSQGTAQGVLRRLPLVLVALVACAGIGLSAGDANAGLSAGQSCAAKKLKEAAKVVGTMLKCVEPPVDQGVPPDPCIQAAGARLAEVFGKLEAKGGCVTTDDAQSIQVTLEEPGREAVGAPAVRPAVRRPRAGVWVVRRRRPLRAGAPQRSESECVRRSGGDRRPRLFADNVRVRCRLPEG